MKIKFNELTKEEIQEVTDMYIEIRDNLYGMISLEEFVEQLVRRCECCKELVLVDDYFSELEKRTMWNGKELYCCEKCCNVVDNEND
jgi:Ca2+-binding EF-hand superfamily protein